MPPKSRQNQLPDRTLVLDNGAYAMKAGFANTGHDPDPEQECHTIPNCIARGSDGHRGHKLYVADQLESCRNFAEMAFRRPIEKGYIVSWDAELDIWKQSFFNDGAKLQCDPHETNLILTEAPNCPAALQRASDEMIFEEFEFASAYRCLGSTLVSYNDIPALTGDTPSDAAGPAECLIVVDSGFSHTTITPLIRGQPVQKAIRRLDVGGNILTNYLKELISLRHFGLMDDSYLVSQIKVDACFVSNDFQHDLEAVWKEVGPGKSGKVGGKKAETSSNIVQDYVLPDWVTTFRGHMRPHDPKTNAAPARLQQHEDFFPLGNERFHPPELLFNPSNIGMQQAGIPELITHSLSGLPSGLWPGFLANVVLVGGTANLPGLRERIENELRALTPAEFNVRVMLPPDPVKYAWLGGARLVSKREALKSVVITRKEYNENGAAWATRKFAGAAR